MPLYQYYCKECDDIYEVNHLMSETLEKCKCEECSIGTLQRVLSKISSPKDKHPIGSKPGDIVNNFIKNSVKDLKKQKEDLKEKAGQND